MEPVRNTPSLIPRPLPTQRTRPHAHPLLLHAPMFSQLVHEEILLLLMMTIIQSYTYILIYSHKQLHYKNDKTKRNYDQHTPDFHQLEVRIQETKPCSQFCSEKNKGETYAYITQKHMHKNKTSLNILFF